MLSKLLDWLEPRSRWSKLKSLGSSNLVRASVLMPAFGYMLLLNENVHQYLTIKYDGWLLQYLPNVWRIWLLFYGSFALAFATILYTAFCPVEVKRYNFDYEMADKEGQPKMLLNKFGEEHGLVKSLYGNLSKWEASIFPLDKQTIEKNFGKITSLEGRMSATLMYHWNLVDIRQPYLRVLVFCLFALGLILLAVPAAITFCQVTWLPVKRLLS